MARPPPQRHIPFRPSFQRHLERAPQNWRWQVSLFATTSEKTFKSHAILTICRYTDKMVFTLTDTGAQACKIEACSESQVFSIGDAGTNCVFAFSVMSPHSPYPYSCPKCATALSTSPQLITSRAHSLTHSLMHAIRLQFADALLWLQRWLQTGSAWHRVRRGVSQKDGRSQCESESLFGSVMMCRLMYWMLFSLATFNQSFFIQIQTQIW